MNRRRMTVLLGGGWTPKKIPGLAMLIDPKTINGADADLIASVSDNFGHTFVQSTDDKKPTLKTGANGINNQPVMRFDGGDLLRADNFLSGTSGSVFAVVKLAASPSDVQTIFSSDDEGGLVRIMEFGAYLAAATPNMYTAQRNSDTQDAVRGGTAIQVGTVYLMIFSSSGTAYTFRLNGASETLTTVTGSNTGDWFSDTDTRDNCVIGAAKKTTEAFFFKGDLALLGVTSTPMDAATIAKLEIYVKARFGLNFT